MITVFHDAQRLHDPQFFLSSGSPKPCPERPARIDALLSATHRLGLPTESPPDTGLDAIAAIHPAHHLSFLQTIYQRWQRIDGASSEVIPNIHPAIHAANLTLQNQPAYALCRPPGHHAFADLAGGFCYLNNSAIAAQHLTRHGRRTAILDVDLHHGNGTQGIFYTRPDVLTLSIHAHPERFYPFFWGYPQERGQDAGHGANLNLCLARGTADAGFLTALDHALTAITLWGADTLVIALGLDAFEGDPFAGLAVTTNGFAQIGRAIASLNLSTLIVQEGGYLSPELGDNLTAVLKAFL